MNILYFASIDFYAKPNPSFHLMATMIRDLIEAGHTVNYVGCSQEGVNRHIPEEFLNNPQFNYKLVALPQTEKSHFVKRYLDGIAYAKKAKKPLKKFVADSDIVFVQSSPTVLYNLMAAKSVVKKRQKIIYNVQDMFPGSSIASGAMPNKLMQKAFFRLQRGAYKRADIIVAISDDMKNKLLEQGVAEDKIEVIVNWFDDTSVFEVERDSNRFIQKYALSADKFYVQYAGTMGYVFDYRTVIEVAKILISYEDIIFHMIGEGSQKQAFINEAAKNSLTNIVFMPLEPQHMVSDVYSACSVCLIPLKKGVIGNSVPSKAGLLMACKRAIVTTADENSGYNAMVNDNKLGIAVSCGDAAGAADALLELYTDREKCKLMGINGYDYGHELYSRSSNMKKYIALLEKHIKVN